MDKVVSGVKRHMMVDPARLIRGFFLCVRVCLNDLGHPHGNGDERKGM